MARHFADGCADAALLFAARRFLFVATSSTTPLIFFLRHRFHPLSLFD